MEYYKMTTSKIVVSATEEKAAASIVTLVAGCHKAYGKVAEAVAKFIGDVASHDEVVSRSKVLYATKAYKEADDRTKGTMRAAIMNMRRAQFPGDAKAKKTGPVKKGDAKAKKTGPVKKGDAKVSDFSCFDALQSAVADWVRDNPELARAALNEAYKASIVKAMRKAA
jgi:hypothetical protein